MQTEKVIDHIVNWLRDYANNATIKGFVVGISGGIDSAVTSSLCAKTGLQTVCVEMPIHQASSQVNRAQEHILQLKSNYKNVTDTSVDLTPVFEEFKKNVPAMGDKATINLALANTRARLRMTSLYYLAGLHGYLVAGTGNKVEDFGVGFYTKYGDGGVDISPIADLVKSQVYTLGKSLGVPTSIQIATPTDGLFGDSRSDEDQIGASYDELEWAMEAQEKGENITNFSDRELEVYKIYTHLNTVNQHKMIPIPVCNIPVNLL